MKRDLYFVYFPSPSHEIWIYGGSIVSNKNIDRGKFCEISKGLFSLLSLGCNFLKHDKNTILNSISGQLKDTRTIHEDLSYQIPF